MLSNIIFGYVNYKLLQKSHSLYYSILERAVLKMHLGFYNLATLRNSLARQHLTPVKPMTHN